METPVTTTLQVRDGLLNISITKSKTEPGRKQKVQDVRSRKQFALGFSFHLSAFTVNPLKTHRLAGKIIFRIRCSKKTFCAHATFTAMPTLQLSVHHTEPIQ